MCIIIIVLILFHTLILQPDEKLFCAFRATRNIRRGKKYKFGSCEANLEDVEMRMEKRRAFFPFLEIFAFQKDIF